VLYSLISCTKESFRNFTQTHNTFSIEYSVQWSDFRVKKQRLPTLELAEILTRHVLKVILIHSYCIFVNTSHVSSFTRFWYKNHGISIEIHVK